MLELQRFAGHVVVADHAARVVAPPYDALSAATRSALFASDPDSYLGALPANRGGGVTAELEDVLVRCRAHVDGLLASGLFRPLERPVMAVLAVVRGGRRSVAIIGDLPVEAYTDGRVLPHEQVRDDRVDELVRYLEVVEVASSAVAITQRPHPDVTAATTPIVARPATVAFRDDDGADVALWLIDDDVEVARLTDAVAAAGRGYIADGHHRAVAIARATTRPGVDAHASLRRVLTAVLPSDHLDVQPFHRHIDAAVPVGDADATEARLEAVRTAGFTVSALDGPAPPAQPGTLHLVVDGRWVAATWSGDRPSDDPVEALDIRLVDRVLLPALGLDPAAATPIAAPLGLASLATPGGLGIALHPPSIDDVLHIADSGGTVPAKTTYVTPKLRSGLLVTPRTTAGPSS